MASVFLPSSTSPPLTSQLLHVPLTLVGVHHKIHPMDSSADTSSLSHLLGFHEAMDVSFILIRLLFTIIFRVDFILPPPFFYFICAK